MTRATSVIDDCINKLKIRGKLKENEPKREKRDTAESILDQKSGPAGPATTALYNKHATHYTIIDFDEVDMRIFLPQKIIISEAKSQAEYHF